MKHIRKYNEDTKRIIDREYMMSCFIELFDKKGTNEHIFSENTTWVLSVEYPTRKDGTIEKCLKFAEDTLNFYKSIEEGIERVFIEYPDIHYKIVDEEAEYRVEVYFSIREDFPWS